MLLGSKGSEWEEFPTNFLIFRTRRRCYSSVVGGLPSCPSLAILSTGVWTLCLFHRLFSLTSLKRLFCMLPVLLTTQFRLWSLCLVNLCETVFLDLGRFLSLFKYFSLKFVTRVSRLLHKHASFLFPVHLINFCL